MEPSEVYSKRDAVQLLDVRSEQEFEAGHVEGSIHITLQEIPARYAEIDAATPVVVTCQIGQRSELAARFLRERGLDAHNLEGGLERWVAEGLPLEAGPGPGAVVDGVADYLDW